MSDQPLNPLEGEQSNQESSPSANPLEQEILDLERQLIAKRAEQGKSVEQAVGFERAQPASQPTAPPTPPASAPQPAQVKADAARLSGVEKDQQLTALVELAFAKGVAHATEVVRNLDNPYLLDEFHDVLIDEFRQKLVDEKKLEEI